MKTKKMSLATIQGKLSRTEMKNVMAGLMAPPSCSGSCDYDYVGGDSKTHHVTGSCLVPKGDSTLCYCSNAVGICNY